MSNSVVLDASALLALLNEEEGSEIVERVLPNAVMSTVNLSETIAVLAGIGIDAADAKQLTFSLIREYIPFNQEQAYCAATLRSLTKKYGLSIGDRACLALAKLQKLKVFSADKVWSKLDLGIDITIIR